jgi:hypothetical protein
VQVTGRKEDDVKNEWAMLHRFSSDSRQLADLLYLVYGKRFSLSNFWYMESCYAWGAVWRVVIMYVQTVKEGEMKLIFSEQHLRWPLKMQTTSAVHQNWIQITLKYKRKLTVFDPSNTWKYDYSFDKGLTTRFFCGINTRILNCNIYFKTLNN